MPVHSVVVGTSMVQHGGRAFCYYGACMEDITPTDLQLLKIHHKASALVGSNDLENCQLETLEQGSVHLVRSLLVLCLFGFFQPAASAAHLAEGLLQE